MNDLLADGKLIVLHGDVDKIRKLRTMVAGYDDLLAANARLLAALEKYGSHLAVRDPKSCAKRFGGVCDCGLAAALAGKDDHG